MNNTPIHRQDGTLYMDQVNLHNIAKQYGTPCYVYSRQGIRQRWQAFDDAFAQQSHLVCYAVKTNSNLAVLQTLAQAGAGFDIVSAGELARVLKAGGQANQVVFSGVGKSEAEMRFALESGIKCFNVESEAELYRLESVATSMNTRAPISIRVNPDVDPKTHAYISTGLKENKFGVSFAQALPLYRYAAASAHLSVQGIDCHIGSQLLDLAPLQKQRSVLLHFSSNSSKRALTCTTSTWGAAWALIIKIVIKPPHLQLMCKLC